MESEDHNLTIIACPNCAYDVEADITTVLRVNDQALDALFQGELNRVICPQCSQEFLYESALVFKSEEQDYFIYYNPDIAPLGWKEADKQMKIALDSSLAELDPEDRPECRLTLTRNEFIEKIALHISNLDDRLIEYLKFHIFSQEEDLNPNVHHLLYDFSRSDHHMIEFSVIDTHEGKLLQNTQTPTDMLVTLQGMLEADDCPVDIDEVFAGLYVQAHCLFER